MKLFQKFLFTGSLVLPGLLQAGTTTQILEAHVPFTFMVGSQEFAPGDYRVRQTENGVIFVQGGGKTIAAISSPGEAKMSAASTLRFTSSHQHEYLVGVQTEGEPSRAIAIPVIDQHRIVVTSSR